MTNLAELYEQSEGTKHLMQSERVWVEADFQRRDEQTRLLPELCDTGLRKQPRRPGLLRVPFQMLKIHAMLFHLSELARRFGNL